MTEGLSRAPFHARRVCGRASRPHKRGWGDITASDGYDKPLSRRDIGQLCGLSGVLRRDARPLKVPLRCCEMTISVLRDDSSIGVTRRRPDATRLLHDVTQRLTRCNAITHVVQGDRYPLQGDNSRGVKQLLTSCHTIATSCNATTHLVRGNRSPHATRKLQECDATAPNAKPISPRGTNRQSRSSNWRLNV